MRSSEVEWGQNKIGEAHGRKKREREKRESLFVGILRGSHLLTIGEYFQGPAASFGERKKKQKENEDERGKVMMRR